MVRTLGRVAAALALGATAAAVFAAGLFASDVVHAQTTLRLGNIYPASHSIGKGVDRLAELVAQKTGGQLRIEVFHDARLGSEREIAESVKVGSVEMTVSGLGGVGRFVQAVQVLELPYLYDDLDHLARAGDAVLADVSALMVKAGLRTLGFFYLGPRDIVSKRPIRTLADMKGLKFRVPESPLYVGLARALGAVPTPIAFPEVYTSLQSGVVEAAEGGPDTLWSNRWYEPAKYVVLTHHILHLFHVTINEQAYQKLPPAQRDALRAAVEEASQVQLGLIKGLNAESLDRMKAAGATILTPEDPEAFRKALGSFNREFAEKLGPEAARLLEKIRAVR